MPTPETDEGQVPGTDSLEGQVPGDAPLVDASSTDKKDQPGAGTAKSYDETYVQKLRQEAANARIAKTAAEKERDDLKQTLLTDEQKKEARTKELEALDATWQTERKSLLTENTIVLAVSKPSIEAQDPEVLALLVRQSPDLEFDAVTGKPTAASIQTVIDTLKTEKSYLFGRKAGVAGNGATSAGNGTNPGRRPPITRATIEGMTREERNARQAEIDQWLMTTGGAEN